MTVQVTEDDVRNLLEMGPHDPFAAVDPQQLEDAITEIATGRALHDETKWEATGDLIEAQDPKDLAIKEATHG